jgi:hypothetical protein
MKMAQDPGVWEQVVYGNVGAEQAAGGRGASGNPDGANAARRRRLKWTPPADEWKDPRHQDVVRPRNRLTHMEKCALYYPSRETATAALASCPDDDDLLAVMCAAAVCHDTNNDEAVTRLREAATRSSTPIPVQARAAKLLAEVLAVKAGRTPPRPVPFTAAQRRTREAAPLSAQHLRAAAEAEYHEFSEFE